MRQTVALLGALVALPTLAQACAAPPPPPRPAPAPPASSSTPPPPASSSSAVAIDDAPPPLPPGRDVLGQPLPGEARARLGTGRMRLRQRPPGEAVVAFDGGDVLGLEREGGDTVVRELATGKERCRLKHGGDRAFAASGQVFVVTDPVALVDARTCKPKVEVPDPKRPDPRSAGAAFGMIGLLGSLGGFGASEADLFVSTTGSFAAVRATEGTRIVDLEKGKDVGVVGAAPPAVGKRRNFRGRFAGFSPDGRLFVVVHGHEGGTSKRLASVRESATTKVLQELDLSNGGSASLEIAGVQNDGNVIAIVDGGAFVMNPKTRAQVSVLVPPNADRPPTFGTIFADSNAPTVVWSADGSRLSVGRSHRTVIALDGREARLTLDETPALLALSANGTDVAAVASNGRVTILHEGGKAEPEPPSHARPASHIAFSPDGRLVATADGQGELILWDARNGALLRRVALPGGARLVAFDPAGERLYTTVNPGTLVAVSVKERGGAVEIDKARGDVSVALTDGFLAVLRRGAPASQRLSIRALGAAERPGRIDDAESARAIAFLPGGGLATLADDQLRLRDRAGKTTATLHVSPHFGTLLVGGEGPLARLVAGGGHRAGVVVDVARGEALRSLPDGCERSDLSRDGKKLACFVQGSLRVLDTSTGKGLRLDVPGEAFAVAFSPDGETIAVSHPDTTVTLFRTAAVSGEPKAPTIAELGATGIDGVVELTEACVRLKTGAVECLGSLSPKPARGSYGKLAPVSGVGAVEGLASTRRLACVRRTGGTVACWGAHSAAPTVVKGLTDVVDLAVDGGRACAVDAGGAVSCWSASEAPEPVVGLARARRVVMGDEHVCALLADGSVVCSGGGLARGGTGGLETVAGVSQVVELASGRHHACARESGGRVACWGWGDSGQLGDGTFLDRAKPVTFAKDATRVFAVDDATCVADAEGLRCAGSGYGFEPHLLGTPLFVPGLKPVAMAGALCLLDAAGAVRCQPGPLALRR